MMLTWLPSSKRMRMGVLARMALAMLSGLRGKSVELGVVVVVAVIEKAPV